MRYPGRAEIKVDDIADPCPGPGEVLVGIRFGGICGTDLHYLHDGGVGDSIITEPLVLGHEVSGIVLAHGDGDTGSPPVGAAVAIYPASPCGCCPECLVGRRTICRNTAYLGSAARTPHAQGAFCERIVVPAHHAIPLPANVDLRQGALVEPLSVALHAIEALGTVFDRTVLVTGAGPVGSLAVAALKVAGARCVYVSDLTDHALGIALRCGADVVLRANGSDDVTWPDEVDLAIEASGSGPGLQSAMRTVRRGGRVVQLGILPQGLTGLLGNLLVTKELELRGSFRFDTEIHTAIKLFADGLDINAVMTGTYPLEQAPDAFTFPSDRTAASKVLLDMNPHLERTF